MMHSSASGLRAALLSCLFCPLSIFATDYYLGTQAASQGGVAVSSIEDLNSRNLQPGDRVFFQGGETFPGNLYLAPEDTGSATQPIRITSFGTGRATIAAGNASAITIYNSSGFAISGLNLRGADRATNEGNGIDAGVYLPGSTKLAYLRFHDLAISGFNNGIQIWAWYSTSTRAWPGFTDVKLSNLQVSGNRSEGIKTWGTWRADDDGLNYSHSDFSITHCEVWDNRGDPAVTHHTGSGIIVSGVDRGTVEYCVAHDNGGRGPSTGGGPFGIWAWEARAVTLQYNLVYNQRTSSSLDGGAYDLDGGSSYCVVQYNYSYNNDGPTIGLIQFQDASPLVNNIVRYNISENDCRKTTQGIVYIGEFSEPHGINGAEIYGNTFFVSTNPKGGKPPLVSIQNHDDIANVRLRNNIFIATHTGNLLSGAITQPARALFQGNNYWGGNFDLAAFRSNGQESFNGTAVGSRLDPQLNSPGGGGTVTDPTLLPNISAYVLRSTSPLIKKGMDLTENFGINPGPQDFYGLQISSDALDVGAAASSVETVEPPPPTTSAIVLDDQFNGSGSLAGRTPDAAGPTGQTWTIFTGNASLANGVVSASTTLRAVIDAGTADGIVETAIRFGATDTGVLLRCSNSSNYLRIALSTSMLRLQKTQSGATTTLATKAMSFELGRTYVIRSVLAGSTVAISVDGTLVGTFTTTFNQTATRHGLLASNSGVRQWERFTVSKAGDVAAPAEDTPVVIPDASVAMVDDQFNGVGSLAGRAPDTTNTPGETWTIHTGSASLIQGAALATNTLRATIDAGVADCKVETSIAFGATDTGILLRSSNSSNYLRIALSTSMLRLQKTQTGATSTIATKNMNFVLGRTYQLSAELAGSSIAISIDGTPIGTYSTSFNQTATRHGLLSSNSGARNWEHFRVSSL